MILVKKLKFLHVLCLSKIDREKVFADVLEKKKPLKTIKTTVCEKRKMRIFPKGIVHGFGQKVEVFSSFVFIKNRSRKSVC